MDKLFKYVASSLVPLVLTFGGCAKLKSIREKEKADRISETLTGKIVFVDKLWPQRREDSFCIVLETLDGKKHYCEAFYGSGYINGIYRKAFYLLKDKEDRGENMTVKGKSYDDVFDIKKIEIEGETIILPE